MKVLFLDTKHASSGLGGKDWWGERKKKGKKENYNSLCNVRPKLTLSVTG